MASPSLMDAQLCYVDDHVAFFTTRPLDEQWGDDWDDVPYEHNAGEPNPPFRDGEDWSIVRVAFDSYANGTQLADPSHGHLNSPFSVAMINRERAVPWLASITGLDLKIYAGTTLRTFIEILTESGFEVFLPVSVFHDLAPVGTGDLAPFLQSDDKQVRLAALKLVGQLQVS